MGKIPKTLSQRLEDILRFLDPKTVSKLTTISPKWNEKVLGCISNYRSIPQARLCFEIARNVSGPKSAEQIRLGEKVLTTKVKNAKEDSPWMTSYVEKLRKHQVEARNPCEGIGWREFVRIVEVLGSEMARSSFNPPDGIFLWLFCFTNVVPGDITLFEELMQEVLPECRFVIRE